MPIYNNYSNYFSIFCFPVYSRHCCNCRWNKTPPLLLIYVSRLQTWTSVRALFVCLYTCNSGFLYACPSICIPFWMSAVFMFVVSLSAILLLHTSSCDTCHSAYDFVRFLNLQVPNLIRGGVRRPRAWRQDVVDRIRPVYMYFLIEKVLFCREKLISLREVWNRRYWVWRGHQNTWTIPVCKSNNSEEDSFHWSDSPNWIVIAVIHIHAFL